MSITTIYDYLTPADYTYNASLIGVAAGASLLLQNNPGQTFTEDFADDTGFTYDPLRAEFVGGVCRQVLNSITENYNQPFTSDVGFTYDSSKAEFAAGVCRQKDQRPVGATFGVTYTSDINGNWGGGTLTGTAVGVPTVSGGKLVLTGGTIRGVTYPSASKFITRQTGCVRFKYTPNYSGIPAGNRAIIGILQGGGEANEIFLYHNSSEGKIFLNSFNSALGVIFDGAIGFFLPTAGVEYEIEFNWDFTTGASRLFINGIQLGSTITGTGTISSFAFIKIGLNYNNSMSVDGSFNDVICFDAPVHTSNYTPGYTVPEANYLENLVTCPIHSYLYNIASLDVPTITETNTPHYVVNGYYWNGAAWAASSDTYATSMTYAQWVANIATFPVGQLSTGVTIKVIFQGSNTQSSIDSIAFTINENTYLSSNVTSPELEYTGLGSLVVLSSLTSTEVNAPRYTIQVARSGNYLYWSGAAWVISNGTFAQANPAATFNTNIGSLVVAGTDYIQVRVHFNDSNIQESISEFIITYTGQIYPITEPSIVAVAPVTCDALDNIMATTGGTGNIGFIPEKDGVKYYWNGSAWVVSAGTYAQSNTIAQIVTNKTTLITAYTSFKMFVVLDSNGTQTASITAMSLFTSFAPAPVTVVKRAVYINTKDFIGDNVTACSIKVKLNNKAIEYNNETLIINEVIDTSISAGYYDLELVETASMEAGSYYIIKVNGRVFYKTVPVGVAINMLDLPDYTV